MTVHALKTTARRGPLLELGGEPRIVILRGGGLGDFLSTTAALYSLRAALPGASITLITSSTLAPFCLRYDVIDRVVVAPAYPGVIDGEPDEEAIASFFSSMGQQRFDLALQWHGGGAHSNGFVGRLGARVTAGFKSEDAPPLDYWIPYDIRQHEVLRYLDLLRLLGIEPAGIRTHLPLLPSDLAELSSLSGLLKLEELERGRYLGIHASAGGLNRRWSPENFALVADRLLEQFDLEGVLVTAGPGQEEDSAAVVESMANRSRAVDLGGRTSLGGLIGLISRLRLLLTNDSGPSHMAVALDVPSLVVFGAAHPINWAPLERTWHRAVAYWASPCRWLVDDGCPNSPDVQCLLGVKPEEVLAEARDLLRLLEMVEPIERVSPETPSPESLPRRKAA